MRLAGDIPEPRGARSSASAPLRGADVVAVVAAMKQGVAARTLCAMGVDAQALAGSARGR